MKNTWKRVGSIGLVLVLVLALLASVPMIGAKKPGPPPPPADPAIAFYMRERVRGQTLQGLWVMNTDGSNKAVIFAEENFVVSAPSWSPNGQSIAWSGYTYVPGVPGQHHGVWRIDVEIVDGEPQGTNMQQLVSQSEEGFISSVAWSPLGDEIAYNCRIYETDTHPTIDKVDAVPATGGTPINIYTPPEGHAIDISSGLAWSSDGTQLAFESAEIVDGEVVDQSIVIIERATGVVTHRLLTGQYNFAGLDWARQGVDKLAFHANGWVYTVDIDTESVDAIIEGGNPSWSPDNSRIVFFQPTIGKVKLGIKIYEFSTGELTTLLNDGRVPDWRRF